MALFQIFLLWQEGFGLIYVQGERPRERPKTVLFHKEPVARKAEDTYAET